MLSVNRTRFLRLAPRRFRFLYTWGLAVGLLAGSAEISLAQSNCGNYSATQQACRRVAVLPWFVGQAGVWETEFIANAGSGDGIELAYAPAFALIYDGCLGHLVVQDPFRGFTTELVDHITLLRRQAYRAKILGTVSRGRPSGRTCASDSGTGSLLLIFEAPNGAALENASATAIYRHFASGSSVDLQTTAPVIFLDQASSEWSASIVESPRSPSTPAAASRAMFAVANLSSLDQAVVIEVFNESGQTVVLGKTPVLAGATAGWLDDIGIVGGGVGGVYSNYLGLLPGIDLSGFEGADFHGTLVLRGDKGGLIAPIVIQANGSLLMSSPVTPTH
jgi:hypothetical protein